MTQPQTDHEPASTPAAAGWAFIVFAVMFLCVVVTALAMAVFG